MGRLPSVPKPSILLWRRALFGGMESLLRLHRSHAIVQKGNANQEPSRLHEGLKHVPLRSKPPLARGLGRLNHSCLHQGGNAYECGVTSKQYERTDWFVEPSSADPRPRADCFDGRLDFCPYGRGSGDGIV